MLSTREKQLNVAFHQEIVPCTISFLRSNPALSLLTSFVAESAGFETYRFGTGCRLFVSQSSQKSWQPLQIPKQCPTLFALLHSLRSLRRVRDLNPREVLPPTSLAVRRFRPLSQLSNTSFGELASGRTSSSAESSIPEKQCPALFLPLSQLSKFVPA